MKKAILLLIGIFITVSLTAQKIKDVVIEGSAPFAKGKEIRLIVFDDLLTYTQQTVAQDVIDKNGRFKLRYKAFETTLAQIAIMTTKAEFFIEPQKEYLLEIDADSNMLQLVAPEEYGAFLHITPTKTDTSELNWKINRFSNFFSNITEAYLPYFTYLKNKQKYDTMVSILHKRFDIQYIPTDFYKSYIYYTFASLEHSMYDKYPDSLYKRYLDNEYILYNNPAYMDFFNTFYDKYLYNSPKISKITLTENINFDHNYLNLFNEVGKDPALQNERIRELVIIKNLGQFHAMKEFKKENIIKLLDYIYNNTHFPEHRKIIINLKKRLTKFRSGNDVEQVTLKEVSGADYKFAKPSKKWTYVQFFNAACADCIREMMILKELQQKFGDSLQIVSISVDFNFNDFSQFRQSYDNKLFGWKFAHFNDKYEWIEKMQILSLPDYLLLSPDGKLSERYPAPPDKGAMQFFLQKFTPQDIEEDSPLERRK